MQPLLGGDRCFAHDPEQAGTAAEARRLGGLRRRREKAVALSYDVGSLDSLAAIRRLLTIAATDTLQLDGSVLRNRLLVNIATASLKLFALEEVEQRLAEVEAIQAMQQEQVKVEDVRGRKKP
jgi:hypothetical protein